MVGKWVFVCGFQVAVPVTVVVAVVRCQWSFLPVFPAGTLFFRVTTAYGKNKNPEENANFPML